MKPQEELNHRALHHLLITPDIIQELMVTLSEEQALEKSGSEEYSLAEYLEYISHIEEHYFRTALDQILSGGADAAIPLYHRESLHAAGIYSGREPEESLAHWIERRDDNLELLKSLKDADLVRSASGGESGAMTLDELLCAWARNDLSAIQGIAGHVAGLSYSAV